MKYQLYADVWFATNFVMDGIALWIAGKLMKTKIRPGPLFLGSFVGTTGSMALFFLMEDYTWYQVGVHLAVNPLMVYLCFQSRCGKGAFWNKSKSSSVISADRKKQIKRRCREFFLQWLLTYLAVILLGGILEWCINYPVLGRHFGIAVILSVLVLTAMEKGLGYFKQQKETIYDLLLITKTGKISLKGFYDTGNLLMDPMVNRPVHIIKGEVLRAQIEKEKLPMRMIPFHSLGQETGLIEAVTLEGMYILKEDAPVYLEKPVFGIAEEKLFQDDRCQVILNGKCME